MRLTVLASVLLLGATGAWAQKDAKDIYLDKCAICHGPDGAAKTARGRKLKMKSVSETAKEMKAEEMIKIVTDGKNSDMNAYGKDLSKDQIKAVVDYYRSLAK
jgi:mono/diheme cytochrome c family protein